MPLAAHSPFSLPSHHPCRPTPLLLPLPLPLLLAPALALLLALAAGPPTRRGVEEARDARDRAAPPPTP